MACWLYFLTGKQLMFTKLTAATQQFGLFLINNQTVVGNFLSITYCAAGDHRQF